MKWAWEQRGKEVEEAGRACVPAGTPGHAEAAARFHRAFDAAWPPGFWEGLERCHQGDPTAVDGILDFIEACPRFFRSGYTLDKALRWVRRPPRSASQATRMRGIVLAAVGRRLHLPFREIPSLARAVDTPSLRAELQILADSPDADTQTRAHRVLDSLPGLPGNQARDLQKRRDNRVGSMLVTAQRRRSSPLFRRTLAVDLDNLTARGRRYLAVAFERAMNWNLFPREELLEHARRLDGPEMGRIWSFAQHRKDEVGERARWLLQQLEESPGPRAWRSFL